MAVLVAGSVALLWLQSIWPISTSSSAPLHLSSPWRPIWHVVYLPIVFIVLVTIVRAAVNIARPNWLRFRDVVSVILDAAGLAIVYTLMFAHVWVVPAATAASIPTHCQRRQSMGPVRHHRLRHHRPRPNDP